MLLQTLVKFMHQMKVLTQLDNSSTTLQEGPNSRLDIF
jgi:hypothetical protein